MADINLRKKKVIKKLTYFDVCKALVSDYFNVFYVNLEDDFYMEYFSDDAIENLDLKYDYFGYNFFNVSKKNMKQIMHPDDYESFFNKFTKENIINSLKDNTIC